MSIRLLVLAFALLITVHAGFKPGADGVEWDSGCDYESSDIKNVKSTGEACGGICVREPQCSHFTWTPFEGGTCWLKHARPTYLSVPADPSFICGSAPSKFTQLFG